MWITLTVKNSGGPIHWGTPTLLWVLPSRFLPGSHSEYQRKNLLVLPAGRRKRNHSEIYQNILFLTKSAHRRNCFTWSYQVKFYQCLTDLEKGKYPTPGYSSHLVPPKVCMCRGHGRWGRQKLRLMKFAVNRHRLTKRLRSNQKNMECFLFCTPHHYISKGLFIAVPFIRYIISIKKILQAY